MDTQSSGYLLRDFWLRLEKYVLTWYPGPRVLVTFRERVWAWYPGLTESHFVAKS